jgi:hypothetical protein
VDSRKARSNLGLTLSPTRAGELLEQAAEISKAAQVCADGGNVTKAIEIVLDVEQLTYEAANLLNAASRISVGQLQSAVALLVSAIFNASSSESRPDAQCPSVSGPTIMRTCRIDGNHRYSWIHAGPH